MHRFFRLGPWNGISHSFSNAHRGEGAFRLRLLASRVIQGFNRPNRAALSAFNRAASSTEQGQEHWRIKCCKFDNYCELIATGKKRLLTNCTIRRRYIIVSCQNWNSSSPVRYRKVNTIEAVFDLWMIGDNQGTRPHI